MKTSSWVQEKEAAKFLGLSTCTIRRMRCAGQFDPGEHWIYSTGKVNGPVLYDIEAINESLKKQTIAAVEAKKAEMAKRRKRIETYGAPHLDELIAEVQN